MHINEQDIQVKINSLKSRLTYYIFIIGFLFGSGCDTRSTQIATSGADSIMQERDSIVSGELLGRLEPINKNYRRINSIMNWDSIPSRELNESAEGGSADYYFQNSKLHKIVTQHFGETFQLLTEYYLLNGNLSFVFSKHHKYNRPFYYDSAAMKENDDSESFDPGKLEITEKRSYFEGDNLLHQICKEDSASQSSPAYLQTEEIRIREDFNRLAQLLNKR